MKVKLIILGIILSTLSVGYAATPKIALSGTMQSKDGHIAYIEGKVYRVGDAVSGYRITEIERGGIRVQKDGRSDLYFVKVGESDNTNLIQDGAATAVGNDGEEAMVSTGMEDESGEASDVMDSEDECNLSMPEFDFDFSAFKNSINASSSEGIRTIVALSLFVLGSILSFIGSIILLVVSFKQSIWWGLAVLFIPFAGLIFIITHWQESSKAFGIYMLGFLLQVISVVVIPGAF